MATALLTDSAIEALKKILSSENRPANTAVRLGVTAATENRTRGMGMGNTPSELWQGSF